MRWDKLALVGVIALSFIAFGYGGMLALIDHEKYTAAVFVAEGIGPATMNVSTSSGDYWAFLRAEAGIAEFLVNGRIKLSLVIMGTTHLKTSGPIVITIKTESGTRWEVSLYRRPYVFYFAIVAMSLFLTMMSLLVIVFLAIVKSHGILKVLRDDAK